MISLLKDLLAHHAWADAVFIRSWEASGMDDGELRQRLAHAVQVQEAFLAVLKGTAPAEPDAAVPGLADLKQRCRDNHEAFAALARTLDEASLLGTVRIPWFPEPPCIVTVAEALTQVCMHSQHHRGQNITRLKALGAQTRNVDYIIWLWKQKPGPRWD